jgi:hypothetical protein
MVDAFPQRRSILGLFIGVRIEKMDVLTKEGYGLAFTVEVGPIDHNTHVALVASQHQMFVGVGSDAVIYARTEVRVERWHPELGRNGSVEGEGWLSITVVGSKDEHSTL